MKVLEFIYHMGDNIPIKLVFYDGTNNPKSTDIFKKNSKIGKELRNKYDFWDIMEFKYEKKGYYELLVMFGNDK